MKIKGDIFHTKINLEVRKCIPLSRYFRVESGEVGKILKKYLYSTPKNRYPVSTHQGVL